MNLKKKFNKLLSNNVNLFSLSRVDQEKLLNNYPIPGNLYERSYFQFTIQFNLLPLSKRILNNIISFFLLPVIFLQASFNYKKKVKKINTKKTAVFPYKNLNYHDALPQEILDEFDVHSINFQSGLSINFDDLRFISKLIYKYFFAPYFLSKCIYKILFYRYIINNFDPDAIISSAEYSFTSSIATAYCECNDIEQINIMHGEKLFYIRDSFFQFSRFYIWDEFYKNLFVKLKAEPNQFIVGTYPSLKLKVDNSINKKFLYTYYLAAEDEETLYKIKETMLLLADLQYLNIRFHPRYSSIKQIQEIFNGFNIENSRETSLENSFGSTENVISLYSSVLLQAYFSGVNIVIDDLNNKNYEKVKQAEYIIFNKKHELLSSLIKV